MKMVNRRNNRLAIGLLIGISLLMLGACGASPEGQPTVESPLVEKTVPPTGLTTEDCIPGILPGQSNRDDVIAILGEPSTGGPTAAEVPVDREVLTYPLEADGSGKSIILQDGTVVLIGMMLDPDALTLTRLQAQLGEPETTTYSKYMDLTMTYLYPSRGLAFIVAPDGDKVFYQECVVPMTVEAYMASWGMDLPTEYPFMK